MKNLSRDHINLLILFLFISLMLFSYYAKAYSNISCIQSERQALLDFKTGLIDKSNRLSSWTGENCCTWEGIGCNMHTGRVVKLDLQNPILFGIDRYYLGDGNYRSYYKNFPLVGMLSPSLQVLKHLQHLDLSRNNFSGIQIPTYFGSFKYMRYLNLSKANFYGQIPTSLGNLSSLQYLDLGHNYMLNSTSLWWIRTLSSLKSLNLAVAILSEANDWLQAINMLPSLLSLNLQYCKLNHLSISSNINFTSLVSLDLSDNYFNTSFPLWLFNVSSIEIINLRANSFQGKLPNMFEKIPSLTTIDLSSNKLESSFPNSLCTLTSLTHINFSVNKFQGKFPFCLVNLTSLSVLRLRSNRLEGVIPFEIGHLNMLSELYLSYNSLVGELTEIHFAKLAQLKFLDISGNFLHLNVSSQWFPPFQLRVISMNDMQVGPQFPPWLETQKRVETLRMSNASISDQIPYWFEQIYYQIKYLDLSLNQISGKAPLLSPDGMYYIDLSFNKFGGTLNSFRRFTYIFMSSNSFTGQIPPLDGNQTYYLSLNDNGLTGNIPNTICHQDNLESLDLSNNHLSGEIPFCLGDLRNLVLLNLANNSLFGQIPSSLGNFGELEILMLHENKFHGNLPSSFRNLTNLSALDLSNNQLSGTLPRWLDAKFEELTWLKLQGNNLNGNIPLELCQLSNLAMLNLAQNNFSGFIPLCFGNFSAMNEIGQPAWIIRLFSGERDFLSNPFKGIELKYKLGQIFATTIALFENRLVGEIPKELMELGNLQSLDLSKNHLHGRIPENIGNLKRLESLDLSMNELSGSIPPSLATVDTLGYLNLSFNRLSGPIPEGNHFQTFDDKTIYQGNRGLCGKPLPNNCSDHKPPKKDGSNNVHEEESLDINWFYAGIGPGFAVGIVGVLTLLWFKKSWRHAYFRFVENLCSRVQGKF